jgi:hypothetical protein
MSSELFSGLLPPQPGSEGCTHHKLCRYIVQLPFAPTQKTRWAALIDCHSRHSPTVPTVPLSSLARQSSSRLTTTALAGTARPAWQHSHCTRPAINRATAITGLQTPPRTTRSTPRGPTSGPCLRTQSNMPVCRRKDSQTASFGEKAQVNRPAVPVYALHGVSSSPAHQATLQLCPKRHACSQQLGPAPCH